MANQNIQIILMIRQTLQHVGNDIEKKIFDRNEEINSNRLKIVNIFHIRLWMIIVNVIIDYNKEFLYKYYPGNLNCLSRMMFPILKLSNIWNFTHCRDV